MQEHVRLAMRRKHAERFETCACGRLVWGNGRASHYRACRTYLTERGYPLAESLCAAIRAEHGVGVVTEVEKRLGAIALDRLGRGEYSATPDLRKMRWRDYRDLVWSVADEVGRGG